MIYKQCVHLATSGSGAQHIATEIANKETTLRFCQSCADEFKYKWKTAVQEGKKKEISEFIVTY